MNKKMNIKKGDLVKMIKGKDRGKTGKVTKVLISQNRVVVEGLNMVKAIQKPKSQGEKGEIINVSRPVSRSNIMLVCPNCKKPVRIGYRFEVALGKNNKKNKIRVCKKCGAKI